MWSGIMQQQSTISQSDNTDKGPGPGAAPPPRPPRKKEGWKSAVSTILILVAAPIVAILLTTFVFQSYEVDGPSMETTLQNQDRLIVWKVPKTLARLTNGHYIPHRGDIVVFVKHNISDFGEPGDKQLIKRVIALPGERVVVRDGEITVYNNEHPDGFNPDKEGAYTIETSSTAGTVDVVVPEGEVFVCGDNRSNSLDSRTFGTVHSDDLIGKLSFRIFPFNKAEGF